MRVLSITSLILSVTIATAANSQPSKTPLDVVLEEQETLVTNQIHEFIDGASSDFKLKLGLKVFVASLDLTVGALDEKGLVNPQSPRDDWKKILQMWMRLMHRLPKDAANKLLTDSAFETDLDKRTTWNGWPFVSKRTLLLMITPDCEDLLH